MADYSGSIASGGSAQVAMAADAHRLTVIIQNASEEDMWYRFNGTATQDSPSVFLPPGDTHFYPLGFKHMIVQALSIIGPTLGQKFTILDTKD